MPGNPGVVVSVCYAGLFVTWFAGSMRSETRECISKHMSVGYPRNLDTYKYPNIMAFCAFQIGLVHQLNSRSAAAGIMT